MDTKLTAVKQSITAAAGDLQQEIQTVSQAQATQSALDVLNEIKEVKRSLTELQRDAERQIANDPNATAKNTGLGASYFNNIRESFVGLSDVAYQEVKQGKFDLGKPLTLADCREANTNAPTKPKPQSRDKQKIAHLEQENSRLEAENKNLKVRVHQLELQLGI